MDPKKADRLSTPFIVDGPHSEKADKVGLSDGELITKYAEDAVAMMKTRDSLQELLNQQPESTCEIAITHFKNWGATQESLLLHVKPTEVKQVVNAVKCVNAYNSDSTNVKVKIGMGGAYHTWASTYPDCRGLLVNTCNLKLEAEITSDGYRRIQLNDSTTVTISPGVTTGELMTFFLRNNICFESDVILPSVTYGGVLTGGCHGTGKDQTSMSDWIVGMKLVDGNGEQVVLPGVNSPDSDVMKAARVNLGLFGVVVEFTVQVKQMSKCEVNNDFSQKLKDVIPRKNLLEILTGNIDTEKLASLMNKYWSLELFWFPFNSFLSGILNIFRDENEHELIIPPTLFFAADHLEHVDEYKEGSKLDLGILKNLIWNPWNDHVWIRGIDRCPEKEVTQEPGIPFWSKVADVAQHTGGQYLLAPMMKNLPGTTPLSVMIGFELVKLQYGTFQTKEVVRTPWAIHYRDGIDKMAVYDVEFAFPTDINDPVNVVKAIRKVINCVKNYAFGDADKSNSENPSTEEQESIRFPLTLCMEMRVMHKSESLLCPASIGDEDHITYLEVLSTVGTPGYESFFIEVAEEWAKLGGIPHWQKQWEFLQKSESIDIFAHIREMYGEKIGTFMRVRKDLGLDPNDIFMNDTMKKLFEENEEST